MDFKSIHVGNPGTDEVQTGYEKIREMLTGDSEHSREGLDYYRSNSFTIGMVGRFLGLSGLEIWNRMISDPDTEIFTSNGNISFLESTVEILTKEIPHKIVADITSLHLMFELNVGDEIVAYFGKLLVAPTALLSISRIIQDKERNIESGYFTMFEKDGQLYKHEITSEQVKITLSYLKDFRDWVKAKTEVSPYLSGFDIDRKQKEDMREAFLPEFFDSLMIVKNEDYIFLTEDDRLRQFAHLQFGIQGIWMQSILAALQNKQSITNEKYYAAMVKLATSNLQHINVDAKTLLKVAKIFDWKAADHFKRATQRLSGKRAEFTSSLGVASTFLLLLAKENLVSISEEILVITLLESIIEGRDLFITVNYLRQRLNISFTLLPFGKIRILNIINVWERAQESKRRGLLLLL